MTRTAEARVEERVLLLAPTARDGMATQQVLASVGLACLPCPTVDALRAEMAAGAGAVLLTELVLGLPDLNNLVEELRRQPPWSDLPVVVLAAGGADSPAGRRSLELFGNATVLERPVQMASLASVTRTLIRSRHRQYQIRSHLLERERANAEIRLSEARTRELADRLLLILRNITDYAIFALDTTGNVTEWMEGAERVKGWKAEEIVGRHLSTFYPPEQVAAGVIEDELKATARTGRVERLDWRLRKGGERFWANEIATAMRDDNGKLLGFTKISRDLTEQRRMEEKLRQAEERHRLIVENARDYAIFMTDSLGRVLTWNTGAERIFGYSEQEILGQDAALLFTPEDRAAGEAAKELATAVSEGRASDDRWQMRRGGERFFASGITTSLRDADGVLQGFVKVCRDLTKERKIEEQRERLFEQEKVARMEAERAMTMRDEFLAVVSHELRTPLTAILLWSKILSNGMVKPDDYPGVFETIRRSAESQQRLIEDLLDISRMMSGKLRLNVCEADLASVVRAAIETVLPMAEAKDVRIEHSLEAGTFNVRIDADRMQQVAWNLLSNGVKFCDKGGRVHVRIERLDRAVRLQVQDTGRGISPDFLPHVFERFRQADATSTRSHGGLGLGLAISQQLVELHGGTIRVASEGLGKGTTMTVELPVLQARLGGGSTPGSSPVADPGFTPAPVLKDVRILVVEDEEDTRAAIAWLLRECAAEVTTANSAAQAVALFREALNQRPFDVLVSDIGMPVQNGYELMRELRVLETQRGKTAPTPAVALTAYAREEDRAKSLAAGCQAHVAKPVEPAALFEVVGRLAGRLPGETRPGPDPHVHF